MNRGMFQFNEGERVISIEAYGNIKGTVIGPGITSDSFISVKWDTDHNTPFSLSSDFFAASVMPLAYYNSPLYQALL